PAAGKLSPLAPGTASSPSSSSNGTAAAAAASSWSVGRSGDAATRPVGSAKAARSGGSEATSSMRPAERQSRSCRDYCKCYARARRSVPSEQASQCLLVELRLRAFLQFLMSFALTALDHLIERLRPAVRLAPALRLEPVAFHGLLQLAFLR